MARFLDIASHQSVTAASAVAGTDVEGVWVKLTGELGYENPSRFQQIDSLRNAGLAVGGYHFGDPRVGAADQARHFGNDAQARGVLNEGSLFPMFDAENVPPVLMWASPAQLNRYIREWRDVQRGEFGVIDFLVYGSESWFTSGWIDPDVWGDDHAWNWVANYNGMPGRLRSWNHPQDALHQWRSNAIPFPGIVASGLDDNVALRGHTRDSLTIGDTDMNLTDVIGYRKRADGTPDMTSPISVQDALLNGYLGEFFGGGDSGALPAFKAANAAAENSAALLDVVAEQGETIARIAQRLDGLATGTGFTLEQIGAAVVAELKKEGN